MSSSSDDSIRLVTKRFSDDAGVIVGVRVGADVYGDIEGVVGQAGQELRLQATRDRDGDARMSPLESLDSDLPFHPMSRGDLVHH